MQLVDWFLRMGEQRPLHRAQRLTEAVNANEAAVQALTDTELAARTDEFRTRLAVGETLDQLLPEAFATAREAARRVLGMRAYDVQIVGGIALHMGTIAEMKTGEGKTLVAVPPTYLNALTGEGVHVVTVNDYLAARDAELMAPVYRFLGLTVGVVTADSTPVERRNAYNSDITYGTSTQLGFDYLRDHMVSRAQDQVQRGHYYAIVDEADSILIDEARTPMIISGLDIASALVYDIYAALADQMVEDVHYVVDRKDRTVSLLDAGIDLAEDHLEVPNLYEPDHSHHVLFIGNALRAVALYERDVHYVLNGDDVHIIDSNTGRVMPNRRYSDGQHQAIEAKERVAIQPENRTLARTALQSYFLLYSKLSGMTGTADTEAAELMSVYKLHVVRVPTHRPVARLDQPDRVYRNARGKFRAILADIKARHAAGQPVLVGTTSVDKSEYLSRLLTKAGIPHQVLNAKQHGREAHIIADAGRLGAVTIATNMAGRGTDIILGGDVHARTLELLHATPDADTGADPDSLPAPDSAAYQAAEELAREMIAVEREKVLAAGGLYVLGTERNDSRRVDNQLRGRSGRQGDPGESRYYLSLDDEIMRIFNPEAVESILDTLTVDENTPIELKAVTKAIARAQNTIEGRSSRDRKNLVEFDEILSGQRTLIYAERDALLLATLDELDELWQRLAEDAIDFYLRKHLNMRDPDGVDVDAFYADLAGLYPVGLTLDELHTLLPTPDKLRLRLLDDLTVAATARRVTLDEIGDDMLTELLRGAVLSGLDTRWREHLIDLDALRDGIHLRSYGNKQPLVEYSYESSLLFTAMIETITIDTVRSLFTVDVEQFLSHQGTLDSVFQGGDYDTIEVV